MRTRKTTIILLDSEHKEEQGIFAALLEFMISLLFLASIYLAFFSCIQGEVCQMVVALEIVIALSVISIIKLFPKGYQYFIVIGTLALFASIIGMFSNFIRGFVDFLNQLITIWNHQYPMYISTFANHGFTQKDSFVFLCIVTLVLTIFISNMIYRKKYYVIGFIAFFILFFTLSFGLTVYGIPMVLFVSAWIATWSYQLSKSTRSRINVILVFIFSGIFLGLGLFATMKYQPFQMISKAKTICLKQMDSFRYGKDTLTQGDVLSSNQLSKGNQKRLKLTSSKALNQTYLKAYIGSDYKNNKWTDLSSLAYLKEQGMVTWLEESGLHISNQYEQFVKLNKDTKISFTKVKVTNVDASQKYLYLPDDFGKLNSSSKYQVNKDLSVVSKEFFGTQSYDFTCLNQKLQPELLRTPEWLTNQEIQTQQQKKYLQSESVYRRFVYKNYLNVDSKTEKYLLKKLGITPRQDLNVHAATQVIRKVLEKKTTVSDTMKLSKSTNSFLVEFLSKQKKGNSVAYATTATLLYRSMGIPARYVEGYYYKGGKTKQVTLTSKDAHAWVEVYFDGMGWLPIEVTPNFYDSGYTVKQDEENEVTPDNQNNNLEKDTATEEETDHQTHKSDDKNKGKAFGLKEYVAIEIMILYFILFVFLLLEVQRALRIKYRKYRIGTMGNKKENRFLFHRICQLIKPLGIQVNQQRPYEVLSNWSSTVVKQESYVRVVKILQHNIFGESKIEKNELRIIEYFYNKNKELLYKNANLFKKFYYRYFKSF